MVPTYRFSPCLSPFTNIYIFHFQFDYFIWIICYKKGENWWSFFLTFIAQYLYLWIYRVGGNFERSSHIVNHLVFHIYIDEVPELVALPAAVARQTFAEAEAFRSAKRIVVEGVDLPVRPLAGGRGGFDSERICGKNVSEKYQINFQKNFNLFRQKNTGQTTAWTPFLSRSLTQRYKIKTRLRREFRGGDLETMYENIKSVFHRENYAIQSPPAF